MKLDFRQQLLTTTLLVGASLLASPAFAQANTSQPKPQCPPGAPPAGANCTTTDTATSNQPETTTPQEGQTTVPSTNAQGRNVTTAQDIVITGTRIPQPNLTSASPVTVLSSQEVKLQGTTRTEDLINSLPQSFAAQGSNVSNGATGTATVNLRGLGSSRTLVLVDGRRLQPGDPRQGSVADLNFIPAALIKRVDVLTGGASSVYGADAVAGVVNFIMDTNFRGFRIDGQASAFMHNNNAPSSIINADVARGFRPPHGLSTNGGAQDIAASFGTGFADNRGSLLAYATYRSQDAVLESSRDYAFCALTARTNAQGGLTGGTPSRAYNCGGSGTSAFATFLTNVGRFHVAGNQLVPGTVPFNYGPYNYFQRPDERYTLGTFAEYEISPGARPYLEAMFMNDTSVAQIAPSGDFFSTNTINCDNPLLSAQQLSVVCAPANVTGTRTDPVTGATYNVAAAYIGRRNVEGGGRQDHLEHTAWRIVGGVKGDLLPGITYDAYYQFGTTRLAQVYLNDFSVTRLGRALDVVANPATGGIPGVAAGTPVCRAALINAALGASAPGADANCVPYNIFSTGGVTNAALAYLQTPGFQTGHVNETVADANMTFDGGQYGIQTPWADHGLAINVGGEYRKEQLETQTDVEFQTGDLAGQGGKTLPVTGQFDVRELFTEVQVPIVSHSFIEDFTVTGGYRYSDYKVSGRHFNTSTYKIQGDLAPVKDVRLRASYNRAVRAPNVVELFAAQNVALGGSADPCAGPLDPNGTTVNGFTAAQCANTGVTAAQFGNIIANPAAQYNALFGGNVNLKPEKADTYTAGIVVQPRWIPGLALTVDYFNIKIKNLISTIPYATILNNCLATNNTVTCGLIHRAPNGSLWLSPNGYVVQRGINVGGESTRGFDLNGSYSRRLGGMGTLNVSYVATLLNRLNFDTGVNPGTGGQNGQFDCVGFYGVTCGTPNPKYRHKLRVGFTLPNGIGISGQWRYFSKVKNDVLSADCDVGPNTAGQPNNCALPTTNPNFQPALAQLKAQNYFDLALTAHVGDRYNLRLGANNIFDKMPPIADNNVAGAPFGNGNTFPQVYDALGRFIFAGVTVDF